MIIIENAAERLNISEIQLNQHRQLQGVARFKLGGKFYLSDDGYKKLKKHLAETNKVIPLSGN
jgi:hypothetical protein